MLITELKLKIIYLILCLSLALNKGKVYQPSRKIDDKDKFKMSILMYSSDYLRIRVDEFIISMRDYLSL